MGAPQISNPLQSPLKAAVQLAASPLTVPAAVAVAGAKFAGGAIGESVGLSKTQEQKDQEAQAAEAQARTEAYNASVGDDAGIDRQSQREIANLYQSGAGSAQIAALLSSARSGKGIYAVRSANQNTAEIQKANPGRAQTTRSLGYGSTL